MVKPINLPMTINVTQDHIDKSEAENCWRSPITLAVYDSWGNVDLNAVDDLYQTFDPSYHFSVSTYTDRILLWVEDVCKDLVLAMAPIDVTLHPKEPITLTVTFHIVDDEELDQWPIYRQSALAHLAE